MKKVTLLLFVFVFLSCFLISCRATRQEVQKEKLQTELTSENVVSYKDTLLFTPKVETSLKIPVSETLFKPSLKADLKARVFTQKNGNSKITIRIIHDTITATASCDSLAIVAKVKQQLIKESKKSESDNSDAIKVKTGYTLIDIIIAFIIAFIIGFALCYILKLLKVI